jgi:hypothetical protein
LFGREAGDAIDPDTSQRFERCITKPDREPNDTENTAPERIKKAFVPIPEANPCIGRSRFSHDPVRATLRAPATPSPGG